MNKRNIGVIVTSTALVGAAIGGGVSAVVYAQNRANAYAPTTAQKQRMSLLGTFLNDGDRDSTNLNPSYKGNPFAVFARAKIAEIVKKILKNKPNMVAKLGYTAAHTIDSVDITTIISRMSLLRLEKNKDTILIMLSKVDANGNPDGDYKDSLLKINLDTTYNVERMQMIGGQLNPFMVSNAKVSSVPLTPLSATSITEILNGLASADRDEYLNSMDTMMPTVGSTKTVKEVQEEKTNSLIQSLILWQVYGVDFADQSKYKMIGDLQAIIDENGTLKDNALKRNENAIESRFNPFIKSMPYFPLGIVVEDEAQLINSDMDLQSTFNLKEVALNKAAIDKKTTEAEKATEITNEQAEIKKSFYEFEAATLLGLELFPDAQTETSGINDSPRIHREYSALSNIQESSEVEKDSGNNAFESALNNYDYFIKGVK